MKARNKLLDFYPRRNAAGIPRKKVYLLNKPSFGSASGNIPG